MTKGRDRRAQKRRRRQGHKKKHAPAPPPTQIDAMVKHAFWEQRADPDFPSYNLVTFRVYGSPMPEDCYEGRAAVERLGRFVEAFTAGRRRGTAPNDRFTPTWALPERMQRLRDDAEQKSREGLPKPDNIVFVTIGRWRFGLSLDIAIGMWMFSAQLVDDGKATNADEQRLAAAVAALGVPDDVSPSPMGKSRYFIWREEPPASV